MVTTYTGDAVKAAADDAKRQLVEAATQRLETLSNDPAGGFGAKDTGGLVDYGRRTKQKML